MNQMSSSTVSRRSTSRKSDTLHQRARAAERVARQTAKPNRPQPPWFDSAVALLKALRLDDRQLAEVCEHLWLHGSAKYVPVLNRLDAERLQGLIDGAMPSASTDETPRPDEAVIASDEEWEAFRTHFDPIESPRRSAPSSATGRWDHPARCRTVESSGWSDHGMLIGTDPRS